jgi:alkaline phosphatase D
MLGYSEMREVLIWIQTTEEAEVQVSYWPLDSAEQTFYTEIIHTSSEQAFTAKLVADQVLPDHRYAYSVIINGEILSFEYPLEFQSQEFWQWRRDPPDFSFAFGSCAYINETRFDRPNESYGGGYEIFESIHADRPDGMIWLGDNVYLRESDWYSRTGVMHRYTHDRQRPEMQALLASTHHYAIWDDHDYGPNNSNKSFRDKEITLQAFEQFWGNPSFGMAETPGCFTNFQWGDADFILLDNRYHRDANDRKDLGADKTILGEAQLDWLFDQLVTSRMTYKIIAMGGQFLNSAKAHETYSRMAPEERQRIIDFIHEHNIRGVLFITGDRHHSELSRLDAPGEYPIWDATVSPFTAGLSTIDFNEEVNDHRLPGTAIKSKAYGLLRFSGEWSDRKLHVELKDSEGETLWSYPIDFERAQDELTE